MAVTGYTYTRIESTQTRVNFPSWLSGLTTSPETKIVFYEEQPTEDQTTNIRVKLLLEVGLS